MALGVRVRHRLRFWATPVLLIVLIGFLIAYLRKLGVLSAAWLTSNKDVLASINSLLGSTLLILAGIVGYYKFLRGRTLTTRAEIEVQVDIIEGPHGERLHSLTVSIRNIGTVSILEPVLVVRVEARHADGSVGQYEISEWFEAPDDTNASGRTFGVVDSGETADYVAEREFGADIWAVTYSAILTCTSGDRWSRRATVANAKTS